ncbi:MAG: hypothetical protein HPY71_15395 [Firmicutes bacterium]|nr:hypothetical protein [Bacillota bacterium]
MISCTEFILAYNEIFKFLKELGGQPALDDFWRNISQKYLLNLEELVSRDGIRGMEAYWRHTLEEEAADYEMTVTDDTFLIDMKQCPSVDLLNRSGVEKCDSYCAHCEALYEPIIERYGYSFRMELLDPDKGVCRLIVRRNRS